MTATKFEGKLFTDDDVVFPSMKDYYHNSLEPILKSYLMKDQEYKYFEDPIGGEDAVGFVTDNRGVFSIKCSKDAFDLSVDAQNSAETSADSFLFYPKNKSVSVGQSAESQKYLYQLCKDEELFANDKFNFQGELENLKEYKKRIRFSLMCVSVPKLPRCTVELLPNEDIEEIKYGDLNKFASNYFFLTHRPDFDKSGEIMPYAPGDTLYFYKNRQVWKKCDSLKITGYSYYYVLANRPDITANIYKTSLKIRNDVLDLINEAEDIRINIPSDVTAADANRYTEYSTDNINNLPFIGEIISSVLLPNKELISDYFTENTYMHAGFNCAGQDKFNKAIAVIYVKVTRNGKKRWINLNKYILVKYFGEVKNQTTNTANYVGTDFYVKNAPVEFKPDTYNIGISCYQDEVSRKSLIEMGQSDERVKIQKKAFAAAGYSLCQNYDDLYNWTVSIGDVSFFVPPTQIRVTNTTNTDRLPILRARGTMAKNIEKSETEIAIDLYFNNEAGINGQPVEMNLWTKHFKDEGELYSSSSEAFKADETKKKEGDNGLRTYYMNGLRALLSEFRFCPFLPIVNKYINETLKISAVSLEQILVKTVPNFPRLIKVVLVMKDFDYQVYMPEVPEAYFDENNKVVNPFDQCINYDVLRYYYQRPILYGNELAKKLKQGKAINKRQVTENGKTNTVEVTEEYSFNSLPFIRDTIIGNNKDNIRTAFLPCEFKDPMICIYAADETYLQQLYELKRTLYQKRMSMGFAVDSFIPNENQKKIIAESSSLYKIINLIIEKYALIKNDINVSAQNEIYKQSLKDSTLNDEINQTTVNRAIFVDLDNLKFPYGAKVGKDGYSEPIIRDDYFKTVYELVTKPLYNELLEKTKELTNTNNEKLVSEICFVINNTRICDNIESFEKELASYGSNIPKVQINISLNLTVNQKEVDEIAKQAYIGEQKEEYKALENQKNNLLDHNGNAAVKIYLPDTSAGQFSSLSFNTNFDEWNRIEPDLKFLEFCNYNEDSLINANEEQQALKQSMDYEDAKSIKFKKILDNALVTDFEASLNNNFAQISLLESSGSAAQYVGGSDTHISWHIRTQDSNLVNVLKSLPDYEAHCMRNYHNVLPCFPIRIESEFSKLMGVFEVSIEDVVVETVPNFPGLYDVSIRAISTDRTLRNRESLRAINDDSKYNENPELENAGETDDDYIDNSGIKRGKIRTRINIRTQKQLYDKMANAELYPDLELPRVDDLVKLGFRFIRYKDKERELNSGFVDPDFYMYYSHIIFSELLKKYIETTYNKEEKESPVTNNMQLSDLTGCRVEVNALGEIDMSTANNKFKNVVSETEKRIKNEQKALHQITTQNLLAKTMPAISVADKKLWTISNKILCSFKESYVINLNRMIADGNRIASNHNEKQYSKLNTYFNETFSRVHKAANDIIFNANTGLKNIDIYGNMYHYIFYDPENYDKRIDNKAIEVLHVNSPYRNLFNSLYITTKNNISNDIVTAMQAILKSIKAVNTASQEYNYEVKSEAWKGCQYPNSIIKEPYYGVLYNGENGTKKDHENNCSAFRLNSPYNIRAYSFKEILPYLSEVEADEILALDRYMDRIYVLDPYYRLKSEKEIQEYLKRCRENIDYSTEAEFRIILWWLARLYQEDIFPSLSYDIERKNAKNNADASKKAVELINSQLKKANENQSFTVNTELIEKIGTFVEQNEAALDTGKFFVAALFAILDEPFSKSELYNHIVARNYDWLNNYIIKLTSRESTDRAGITDKNGTKLRKFLLALCGYEFIDDPSYIGKSSEVTPAEQFSSLYNTKLALAACEDPNMYLFHSYYDMLRNDYRGRLLRAFPTYYCMFIDEGREVGLWKIFDNFYSMTGINEISITKSRKIAADTCSIVLSNNYNTFTFDDEDCYINYVGDFWGELYDSLFDQKSLALEMDRKRRHATKYVNRAKLSPGIRIHIRMGYGSDARELAGLFNGVIAEVNPNAKTIDIVAQGNGIELLNPISLETDADEITQIDDAGLFKAASSGGTPRNILAGMLTTKSSLLARYFQGEYDVSQSWFKDGEKHWDTDFMFGLGNYIDSLHQSNILGIKHFGEVDDRSVFPGGEICQNLYDITKFPALDDDELNFYRSKKEENSHAPYISFNPNGRTFWDAMHICKSVGPDFICSTAPFGFRDTIFLGRPRYYYAYEYVETESGARVERRKPFQQHYFLYGNSDIMVNDITASSKLMKTVATGVYTRDRGITSSTEQVGPIFVDKDIYPEEQKSFIYDTRLTLKPEPKWYNFRTTTKQNTINDGKWIVTDSIGSTVGKGLRNTAQFFANVPDQLVSYLDDVPDKIAWSSTASALKDSVKEMYQGGLVVIGYPSIKPYDRLYINDAYNDISGQVEVRDVVHIFSMESGLISSINVDAISVVDDRKEFYVQKMSCTAASEAVFLATSMGMYKLQPKIVASIATKGAEYLGKIGNIAGSVSSNARLVGLQTFFNNIKDATGTIAETIKNKGLIKSMTKTGVSVATKFTSLKNGLALFGMTPPGWLAIGTWLVLEAGLHVIAHNIQSSLMFNVKNSQALIIFPLKRYGMVYTAGLSGSMGLVYGSPTFNDVGPIEKLYAEWLAPSEEDGWLTGMLKSTFLSEDVQNEAAKYRRDNTAFFANNGNPIGDGIQAESTVFGVAKNRGSGKFSSVYGMSTHNRINPFEDNLDEEEKAKVLERYNNTLKNKAILSMEDFTAPKIYNNFRNVAEDIRFRKYVGPKESPNGFLRILHLEKQLDVNSGLQGISGIYHKDASNTRSLNIPYIRYNDGKIYDIPYLSLDAFNVLHEIVEKAYQSIVKINRADNTQIKADFGSNHIILFSALRIGNESDKAASAGNTFTIKATGNLNLGKILNELYENKGKKVFYSDQKGDGQYKITVFPVDYVAKN